MDVLQKKDIFVGLDFTRITCVSTHVFISICLYLCVYYPKITLQHNQRRLLYEVHPATHCNTLQHPAKHCQTLRHYNTLQHTTTQRIPQRHLLYAVHPATPCNSLQHPASPCNTLQHTTTQRIPPRHLLNVDLRRRPLFEEIPKKTGAPKKTFAAHPYTCTG